MYTIIKAQPIEGLYKIILDILYIPNSSSLQKHAPSTTGLAPNYVGIFKNTKGLVQNNPRYGKHITNASSKKPLNYTSITPLPP